MSNPDTADEPRGMRVSLRVVNLTEAEALSLVERLSAFTLEMGVGTPSIEMDALEHQTRPEDVPPNVLTPRPAPVA